jgi:hypothetical protein
LYILYIFVGNSEEPKPKRRRVANRVWLKEEEFQSPDEALKAVSPTWKKSSRKYTNEGYRVEYRCTKGKYRKKECPAGLMLLYHSSSGNVSLYRTDTEHGNHVTTPSRGLSAEIKTFLQEKVNEGVHKPNALLALIRRKGLVEPAKQKIIAYLRTLRYVGIYTVRFNVFFF